MRHLQTLALRGWFAAAALAASLAGSSAQAQSAAAPIAPRDPTAACAAFKPSPSYSAMTDRLARITDAPTTIESAKIMAPERGLPEYCLLEGHIAPTVGFVIKLPTQTWNGKMLMGGCGGPCGYIRTDYLDPALARNYAIIMTDMGHKGAGWSFGYQNLQNLIDFGSRSTHVVAVASKVLIDQFYGQGPANSYFLGCSTGGRQAMVEAQRFPQDFNGIIGGAPPYDQIGDTPLFLSWGARANVDAQGKPLIDAAMMPMIHKAVMDACQTKSDAALGVLLNPMACKWDPGAIVCKAGANPATCLSPAQADVVRKIYSGATDSKGRKLYYGMMRGSELRWSPAFVNTDGKPGIYLSGFGGSGNSMMTYGANIYPAGPTYKETDFDYDQDPQRLGVMEPLYDARNHDLRAFKATGGKFILYHGWDDYQIPPEASIDYYETATRLMGGPEATRSFFRLFMLPGVGHCISGPGGSEVDYLTALENWVEKGQAPDQLVAYRFKGGAYPMTKTAAGETITDVPRYPLKAEAYDRARPVYAYPAVAKWDGKTDPAKLEAWSKASR